MRKKNNTLKFHFSRSFVLIVLLFSCGISYSQTYEEIKDQTVELGRLDEDKVETFFSNLYLFIGDDFDSVDVELLTEGPTTATIILDIASKKSDFTYGDIYQKWLEVKEIPEYSEMRSQQMIMNELVKRPADIRNWEEDKRLLIEMGTDDELLERLRVYVEEYGSPSVTYDELIDDFADLLYEEEVEEMTATRKELDRLLEPVEAIDEIALLQEGNAENKPILLYFTGWNCVNCRRIEQNVLVDSEIFESISEDFILKPLYVDDRTKLPEAQRKEVMLGERIMQLETVGDANMFYQLSRFDIASQPYFVVLNANNEVLGITDYESSPSVEDFMLFLKESQYKMK